MSNEEWYAYPTAVRIAESITNIDNRKLVTSLLATIKEYTSNVDSVVHIRMPGTVWANHIPDWHLPQGDEPDHFYDNNAYCDIHHKGTQKTLGVDFKFYNNTINVVDGITFAPIPQCDDIPAAVQWLNE